MPSLSTCHEGGRGRKLLSFGPPAPSSSLSLSLPSCLSLSSTTLTPMDSHSLHTTTTTNSSAAGVMEDCGDDQLGDTRPLARPLPALITTTPPTPPPRPPSSSPLSSSAVPSPISSALTLQTSTIHDVLPPRTLVPILLAVTFICGLLDVTTYAAFTTFASNQTVRKRRILPARLLVTEALRG
jgi:hypothetical protein